MSRKQLLSQFKLLLGWLTMAAIATLMML